MTNPVDFKKTSGKARSSKWPALRKKVIEERGECAACGTKEELEAHHIANFSKENFTLEMLKKMGVTGLEEFKGKDTIDGHELELHEGNLIVLCEERAITKIKNFFKGRKSAKHHLTIGHTYDGKSGWKVENPDVIADAKKFRASLHSSR